MTTDITVRQLFLNSRRRTVHDLSDPEHPNLPYKLTPLLWQRLRTVTRQFPPDQVEVYKALSRSAKDEVKNLARVEFDISSASGLRKTASVLKSAAALLTTGQSRISVSNFVRWTARNASIVMVADYLISFVEHDEETSEEFDESISVEELGASSSRKHEFWTETREIDLLKIYYESKRPKFKNTYKAWAKQMSADLSDDVTDPLRAAQVAAIKSEISYLGENVAGAFAKRIDRIEKAVEKRAKSAHEAAEAAKAAEAAAARKHDALLDGFEEQPCDQAD